MLMKMWLSAKIHSGATEFIALSQGLHFLLFSRLDEKTTTTAKSVDNSGLGRLVLCACKIGCVSEATARTDGRGS